MGQVLRLNENEVIEAVCSYLGVKGYKILQKCATTDKGVDVIAENVASSKLLLIEAKGGTSTRSGSSRFGKDYNASQVRHQVAHGIYTAICSGDKNKKRALAFPDCPVFRKYLNPTKEALQKLEIVVFLVQPDLSVIEY